VLAAVALRVQVFPQQAEQLLLVSLLRLAMQGLQAQPLLLLWAYSILLESSAKPRG
jgi:hypothetical protein